MAKEGVPRWPLTSSLLSFSNIFYHLTCRLMLQIRVIRIIIDRKAGEIMRLVVSVCLFVCLSVCLSERSCLNRLTYDLDFWHEGQLAPSQLHS